MTNLLHFNHFFVAPVNKFLSSEHQIGEWIGMNFKKLRQLVSVQGSGRITTEERAISSFLRLHISIPCALELIDSDEEKVLISTDDNLHSLIEVINSGRTLYVSAKTMLKIPAFTALKIQVYTRQLDNLNIGAHGDVIMTAAYQCVSPLEIKIESMGHTELRLSAPSIKLSVQSHGNFKIAGECNVLSVKTQSHGDFDARDLQAQNVTFSSQSKGNAWLYAGESLIIKHASAGFVHYYGEGILKDIKHNGSGEVKHCKS